jgi:hypothetical protein
MATAVTVVAVAAVAAAMTKTLASIAMLGVTDNNQLKGAEEEMAAEMAMATVTTTMTAREMMAAMATAVIAVFLPNRQQSAKRGSRRNGGRDCRWPPILCTVQEYFWRT